MEIKYFTAHERAGRKIPNHLNEISKHFKRMNFFLSSCSLLKVQVPSSIRLFSFLPFLYSAFKCMIMSSNQEEIVLVCSEQLGHDFSSYLWHLQPFKQNCNIILQRREFCLVSLKSLCGRLTRRCFWSLVMSSLNQHLCKNKIKF